MLDESIWNGITSFGVVLVGIFGPFKMCFIDISILVANCRYNGVVWNFHRLNYVKCLWPNLLQQNLNSVQNKVVDWLFVRVAALENRCHVVV